MPIKLPFYYFITSKKGERERETGPYNTINIIIIIVEYLCDDIVIETRASWHDKEWMNGAIEREREGKSCTTRRVKVLLNSLIFLSTLG